MTKKIYKLVITVLFLFFLVSFSNAYFCSLGAVEPKEEQSWKGIGDEIARYLSLYLAINTTNPPGNENKAALYLKSILLRNGIPSKILVSPPPGGHNLIAVLKGDDSKKPILLLNNSDVLKADEPNWTVPPFSGSTKDGFIYGRGSLEMKGLALMQLFALIEIKKRAIKLKRDLIFLTTADAHNYGEQGAKWIVENNILSTLPEYVLGGNSYGVNNVLGNGKASYLIATSEKRTVFINIEAPTDFQNGFNDDSFDNPIISDFSKIFDSIEDQKFPDVKDRIVFKKIERDTNFIKKFFLKSLSNHFFWGIFRKTILKDPVISNLVNDSFSFDEIKQIEIDKKSYTIIKARLFLNSSVESHLLIEKIKERMSTRNIEFKIEREIEATNSEIESELYTQLFESIKTVKNGTAVAPYELKLPTDLRFFRNKGIIAYGLAPVLITREQFVNPSGANERISIDQLGAGSRIIYETISRMNR